MIVRKIWEKPICDTITVSDLSNHINVAARSVEGQGGGWLR